MTAGGRLRAAGGGLLLGWGGALLLRPESTARAVCGPGSVPPGAVVWLLGARCLAQQALLALVPSRRVAVASLGTDVLHALSMLVAARLWPQYRRAAVTSAGVAAVSAALSAATAAAAAQARPPVSRARRPSGPRLRVAG